MVQFWRTLLALSVVDRSQHPDWAPLTPFIRTSMNFFVCWWDHTGRPSLPTHISEAWLPTTTSLVRLFLPRTNFERHWPLQTKNIDGMADRCMWKSMMQGSHSPVWLKRITDQSVQKCALLHIQYNHSSDVGLQQCSTEYTRSYQTTQLKN